MWRRSSAISGASARPSSDTTGAASSRGTWPCRLPQLVDNLVILNLPHPNGLARELRTNPEQIKNSEYARNFQRKPPTDPTVFFGRPMTAETLSGWVRDPAARKRYVEAFERSDFEAMLNYYKRNYPTDVGPDAPPPPELPKVKMPVLMFHGLDDQALHADGLSGTWKWLEKDLTLVTVPGAGHFVQQDAADLVTIDDAVVAVDARRSLRPTRERDVARWWRKWGRSVSARLRDVARSRRKSYGARRFSPADNRPTRGTTRGARVSGANGGNAALARRLASAAAASGLRETRVEAIGRRAESDFSPRTRHITQPRRSAALALGARSLGALHHLKTRIRCASLSAT